MRNSKTALTLLSLFLSACSNVGLEEMFVSSDTAQHGQCQISPPREDERFDCNSSLALCDRPYDEVAFPGTHNSFSNLAQGYTSAVANHYTSISDQLERGIRVINIDVHGTSPTVCHSSAALRGTGCALGARTLEEVLYEISDWTCSNPYEVLTLTFESHVEWKALWSVFESTGVEALTYVHDADQTGWPTLREMIVSGRRIVVFVENKSEDSLPAPEFAWTQLAHAQVAGGPGYGADSVEQLMNETRCDFADPNRPFFLLEHFANDRSDPRWLSGGNPDIAEEANSYNNLSRRVFECLDAWTRLHQGAKKGTINFVSLDFSEKHVGALLRVVDQLNGL